MPTRDDPPRRRDGTGRRITLAAILITVVAAAACTDQPLPTGAVPPAGPRAFPRAPNGTENPRIDRRVSAIQISAGYLSHVCALESDGQVVCWGAAADVPLSRHVGPYTWVAAGGAGFADCGILVNGTIDCFAGFTTPPTGTFTRLSLGIGHGCGIRTDQTIACWGDNEFGQATPPAGSFIDVDAGAEHTCGIRTDNTHECWGNPASSDIDPDSDNSVPDWTGTYVKVSAGLSHTCAIKTSSGTVICGGANGSGQAGGTISSAIDISAGRFHTCAVSSLFTLHCWGLDVADETEPPSGLYTSVAVDGSFSCAITKDAGNVRCWGSRNFGIKATPYEISDAQATTTTLEVNPRPSTFGARVEMKATVTVPARVAEEEDLAEQPSTGRVMFIDGGTCASPTTVLAAGVGIFEGTASFVTRELAVGTHSVGACYLGGDGLNASGDGASLEVTAAVTTTSITLTPQSQQYSDRMTLEAAVTPASVNGSAAAGAVQFTIDNAAVGGPVAVGAGGKATLPNVQMSSAPGPHSVGAQFTSSDETVFKSSTAIATSLGVTKEDASIVYGAGNTTAMQVTTPGGSLAANALALQVGVKETEPDAAATPGTTGIGSNIGGVGVTVTLVPIGPGSPYILTCLATGVTGTGYATTRNFTCKNPAALPVNVYAVQATLTSDYYQATQYEDVVTVFDPVAGFVTGGGTFRIDGDLVRFGINLKYKTNGKTITATQGSVFAVRHHANGHKSRFESNSINSAVAVGEDPTVPMGWAVVSGKANYSGWDAAKSSDVSLSGQPFTVYVEDRGEPGNGKDRVWMGGPGALALPGTLSTAKTDAVTLTGGNVAVPHKSP